MGKTSPSADLARVLTGIGLVMAGVYLLRLTLPMSLWDYIDQPLADLPQIIGVNPVGAWYWFDTVTLLFGLYVWGYVLVLRWARQNEDGLASDGRWPGLVIAGLGALFSLILLGMFPVTAGDVFSYLFYGRVWVFEGLNPFTTAPNMFTSELTYPYTVFRNSPTVYGAGFTHLSAVLARLAGDNLLAGALWFKVTLILGYALTALAVYQTLRRTRPALALAGVYLIAWSPLVQFNTAGDAHNDILMAGLIVLALLLVQRGHWTWAGLALVLSVSMKWVSLILLPMFVLAGLRALGWRRWPVIASGLLIGFGVAVIFQAPFYAGPRSVLGSIPLLSDEFTSSFATVLRDVLTRRGVDDPGRIARWTMYAAFGALYLRELVRVRGDFDSLVYGAYQALFLYLVFGTQWFQPWYVTWLVGVGALLVGTPVANRTIVFSVSAMLVHVVTGFGWRMEWFGNERPLIQLAAVCVAIAPPVIVWLSEHQTYGGAKTPTSDATR